MFSGPTLNPDFTHTFNFKVLRRSLIQANPVLFVIYSQTHALPKLHWQPLYADVSLKMELNVHTLGESIELTREQMLQNSCYATDGPVLLMEIKQGSPLGNRISEASLPFCRVVFTLKRCLFFQNIGSKISWGNEPEGEKISSSRCAALFLSPASQLYWDKGCDGMIDTPWIIRVLSVFTFSRPCTLQLHHWHL